MENTYAGAAICLIGAIFFIGIIFLASAIRIVREETRLSVYRLGQYIGDKGPGIVFLIPFIDRGVLKELSTLEKPPSTDQDS